MVQNPGSSSGSHVSSTTGGQPPAQVTSVVSEVTSSTRQTPIVGQTTIVVPSMKTKEVTPSTSQPSGVQPIVNQPSWGYTHPGNIPSVSNVNLQPTSIGMVYPSMPYPGNMFIP